MSTATEEAQETQEEQAQQETQEIKRYVPNTSDKYIISSEGYVYHTDRLKKLVPQNGVITLYREAKEAKDSKDSKENSKEKYSIRLNKLMVTTFSDMLPSTSFTTDNIDKSKRKYIRHLDGNKDNCSIHNLALTSKKKNTVICLVDKMGIPHIFSSIRDAHDKTGASLGSIHNLITGKIDISGDYVSQNFIKKYVKAYTE